MTKEEQAKARQKKINDTLKGFDLQLIQLGKKKQSLLDKVLEAKRLGLKQQEQQARGLLGNCLAQEKRVLGMQMQLELAVESRDLSNLEQSFIECVNDMSVEISSNVTKFGAKKAKKNYMKTLYKINEQNTRMDDLLDAGDYAIVANTSSGQFSKFDDEIDSLVEEAEFSAGTNSRTGERNR